MILIVVDALRADHLGVYGYNRDTSPHIDLIAKQGVLFRDGIAASDWTLPSVASIMTSLYPPAHGAQKMPRATRWLERLSRDRLDLGPGERLDSSVPTLASVLSDHGYRTAGVVSGAFVRALFGIGHGFQEYHDRSNNLQSLNDSVIFPWLAKNSARKFFLYIHPIDVHEPYGIVSGSGGFYPKKWDGDYHGLIDGKSDTLERINKKKIRPSKSDLAHVQSLYDDGISYLDGQIGRRMEDLQALGLLDRTLIVFTADHGDGFREHGLLSHGNSPYDELLKVPLIFRFPDGPRGKVLSRQASSVDIFPTILDFLGITAPAGIQGESLLPAVQGRADKDRVVFSEAQVYLPPRYEVSRAAVARTQEWKLIDYPGGRAVLYRLSDDPGEKRDVLLSNTKTAALLQTRLDAWRAENEKLRARPTRPGEARVELDQDTLGKLKAAGYAH